MLLYYITDRTQFREDESARQRALLRKIAACAQAGVDFVQLREKDLSSRELEALSRAAVQCIRENSGACTRLLINSRTDVAIAVGADGVHLRSDDVPPSQVVEIWKRVRPGESLPIIGVSCHTIQDVIHAANEGASFAVFAPVFGKKAMSAAGAAGLPALREACQQKVQVLALGGITLANAKSCLEAGAAGIAGIRLFQENDVAAVVKALRG